MVPRHNDSGRLVRVVSLFSAANFRNAGFEYNYRDMVDDAGAFLLSMVCGGLALKSTKSDANGSK